MSCNKDSVVESAWSVVLMVGVAMLYASFLKIEYLPGIPRNNIVSLAISVTDKREQRNGVVISCWYHMRNYTRWDDLAAN